MSDAMSITEEDSQSDHDGSDGSSFGDERDGLIKEALQGLVNKCEEMVRQDRREELENPETLSSEDIAARTAILVELHTELMPALQRKLVSMATAVFFNRPTSDRRHQHAQPLRDQILEVLTDLGPSLEHIRASIIQLAPWTHTHNRMFSHRDQDYGQLKKFRCDRLVKQFDSSICALLSEIFTLYMSCLDDSLFHSGLDDSSWLNRISEKSERCRREIQQWIQIATGSDFRVLQTFWQGEWQVLAEHLRTLRSIKESVDFTTQKDRSSPNPMPRAFHRLFTDAVQLVELAVNFYLGLLSRQCLITFPDNLSTNELEQVAWRTSRLAPIVNNLVMILKDLYQLEITPMHYNSLRTPQHRELILEQTKLLKVAGFKLQKSLDAGLVLFCFHHLPSSAVIPDPRLSKNIYRTMFYETRSRWSRHMTKYRNHLKAFRRLFEG